MNHSPSADGATDHRAALVAGFLGWTLDAFDFFLVVMCLTAIGREFHQSDAKMALATTVTLAFRPLGAFLFGLMADRYGRRLPLMLDLVFYSVIEVLSGLAPNYTTFLVLRALFGIGMGGEWGVGASLAMEKVPRGCAACSAASCSRATRRGICWPRCATSSCLRRWDGARSFSLAGCRRCWRSSCARASRKAKSGRTRHADWAGLGRAIVSNWKLFLYIVVLMTGMNLAAHGTQDMYPTFLERQWGMGVPARAVVTACSMVGAILGGTLAGWMSDRFGRRRVMIVALALATAMVPLWAFAPSLPLLIAGAFAMQFCVQGAWGVIPAHLSELSPDSVRGFLPGFGYQCGVFFSSSVTYIEAVLAKRTSYSIAMAATAGIVFLIAAAATAAGSERRGTEFGA